MSTKIRLISSQVRDKKLNLKLQRATYFLSLAATARCLNPPVKTFRSTLMIQASATSSSRFTDHVHGEVIASKISRKLLRPSRSDLGKLGRVRNCKWEVLQVLQVGNVRWRGDNFEVERSRLTKRKGRHPRINLHHRCCRVRPLGLQGVVSPAVH